MTDPFQLTYYVNRRDRPQEWKCQPNKWLSSREEVHEILVGWFSVTLGSFLSAALASWVVNGGHTTLYYDFSEWADVKVDPCFHIGLLRQVWSGLDRGAGSPGVLCHGLHYILAPQGVSHALPLQGNVC